MLPTAFDKPDKPARQFSNAVDLPSVDSILRDQFAANPEGDSASKNKVECILLIHASCGDQRKVGKHAMKRSNVGLAVNLSARDHLYEIAALFPGPDDLGRSEVSWKYDDVLLYSKFDQL
jgi:hypothetical protein